ncbi:MAG: NUDIX domain-containing protein [bacterium]|nr:NUDIX domain-containing protein [bacterium]
MNEVTAETVAKVLLINNLNQALILTVGEYKERPDKSFKPDLPGGLVDPGESERDAAVREVYEEAGFQINAKDLQLAYSQTDFYGDEQKSVTKLLYLIYLNHTPDVKISWEHASHDWVDVEGITESVEFRPFYKSAVKYCIERGLIG